MMKIQWWKGGDDGNVDQTEVEMMDSAVIPIPVRLQKEIRQQFKEDRFSKT